MDYFSKKNVINERLLTNFSVNELNTISSGYRELFKQALR